MHAKRLIFLTVILLGFVFGPTLGNAATFTIVDEVQFEGEEGYVQGFLGFGPNARLTYWHPQDTSSFPDPNLPLEGLVDATLTLSTVDDGDRRREFAFTFTNGEWWNAEPLQIGGSALFDVDIAQIVGNGGALEVTVVSFLGDFLVTRSLLELVYDDGQGPNTTVPTPEPGTLMLMGSGLLGVAAALRRKRAGEVGLSAGAERTT